MRDLPGDWFPEVAVDFDGTLAEYNGWQGSTHIGKPIPIMLQRVKAWCAEGRSVVIFTARLSGTKIEADNAKALIQKWLVDNGLPKLDVTNIKRKSFVEFWDDRAIRVERNTGVVR